ncbi:MAG: beta-galactosidase trimerization domain-containing protein, partial [Candidatus Aminicenantes bacterium]|nr:beta-galactosidase trimerization domain-containing protein [Candidatus Aminicenantes bacterium]
RAEAAGRVARVVTENRDLFLNSLPPEAQVAILYNPLNHMVGGQQQYTGEGQPIGYNNVSESLQGVHRAFFEKNIPVDFLHVMDLVPQRLKQYQLLIAPFPVMMAREHIAELIDYVGSGGVLLAEARCGWIDEAGFSYAVYPGAGLHEVFGCREAELLPLQDTSPIKISTEHPSLPLVKPGDVMDALFFEESFELLDGESRILAEFQNGKPAAVYSEYGHGKAVIVGSFLGSAYHHFQNPNNAKFFTGMADWLNIAKPVAVQVDDPKSVFVEARILNGRDFKILVGFNRSELQADVEFFINDLEQNTHAVNLESGHAVPTDLNETGIILKKKLQPREVWVVLLK